MTSQSLTFGGDNGSNASSVSHQCRERANLLLRIRDSRVRLKKKLDMAQAEAYLNVLGNRNRAVRFPQKLTHSTSTIVGRGPGSVVSEVVAPIRNVSDSGMSLSLSRGRSRSGVTGGNSNRERTRSRSVEEKNGNDNLPRRSSSCSYSSYSSSISYSVSPVNRSSEP